MASALSPVAVGLYTALAVPAVLTLAPGGVCDAVPLRPVYPFVWVEVQELELGMLGGGPLLAEVEVRVHVYTQAETLATAQAIAAVIAGRLRHQTLTLSGFAPAGRLVYIDAIPLPHELLHGEPCQELLVRFRLFVEETA